MKIEQISDKKFIGWLPAVLALVVIFQSVMLVNFMKKEDNQTVIVDSINTVKTASEQVVFGITSETKDFKVGKIYEIAVTVKTPQEIAIDGADIFVKVDPAFFDVTDLKQADGLPSLAYKSISKATGMVSAGLYISAKDGLVLEKALEKKLITFKIQPKIAGKAVINLTTRNDSKEFATMIVETQTKKVLPFAIEQLQVSVSK